MSDVRILVVEDESVVAKDIQWSLKSLGYIICGWASSGTEAVEKVKELQPDLVLMDIVLKGDMDGVQASDYIRTRFGVPVVYLTAYADENTLERAKLTEPFGYILKPFEERELHTTIEVALYRHKMERKVRESEQWLSTTLRSIGDGVITVNTSGHVTFMNVVAELLTGVRESSAIGQELGEIFRVTDDKGRALTASPVASCLQEGISVGPASHYLVSGAGGRIPIEDSAAPIKNDLGQISGAVVVLRDVTMRKQSEELLKKERETFYSILQKAPYGVILFERSGRYLYINPEFTRITGYTLQDIPNGREWFRKAFPDKSDRGRVIRVWLEDARRNDVDRVFRVRIKNGEPRELEFRSTVLDDVRLIVTATDVTERRHAEEALRASEEKYRELVQNANSIILRRDSAGTITFFNEFAQKFFGYTEGEILGKNIVGSIVPDRDLSGRSMADLVKDMGVHPDRHATSEIENMRRNGERAWVSWTNKPVFSPDGTLREILCVGTDVTERRRHEDALRLQAQIIDQIHDSVISTDLAGLVTIWNKGAERLYGYKAEEVIGRHLSLVYPEDQWEMIQREVLASLRKKGNYEIEARNVKKSGELFWVHLSLSLLRDSKGTVTGFIGYHIDITDHKRLEEQLRHSQKMEAIGQLAGGIAHDFNNILTAIIGYGNLLQMRLSENDQMRSYVDQILASAERAASLTQSLLAFGRKQIIDPKPVNVNEIIRGVEKLLSRLIREDIELRIEFTDKDLTVMADSAQMGQVLMNLATNARDAVPDEGSLTIQTGLIELDNTWVKTHGYGKPGMYALIAVTDTGGGMTEKTRQRVFEPFFTTKEIGKGTGLGLSIVYGIVKQHNGFITVYSEVGRGTIFKIYLPVITPPEAETGVAELAPFVGGTETILVAEDDAEVRKLTKNLLEEFGYSVIEAEDGEDAVVKFLKHKKHIELVILDVVMPRKNGKEVYESIRRMKPDMKALFTSGYTADVIHKKGVLDEELDFISKPVSPKQLLSKIRELLDRK
jgi:PAS domain S-box-containing protein